jgi:hypothetical protein
VSCLGLRLMQADWRKIEEVLAAALRLDKPLRAAFVKQACGSDELLRHEVESLLNCESRVEQFMNPPALEFLASGTAAKPPPDTETEAPRLDASMTGRVVGQYRCSSGLGPGRCDIVIGTQNEVVAWSPPRPI